MIEFRPVTLEDTAFRLEPLSQEHLPGIEQAAADGELWKLWFTGVPGPGHTQRWFEHAMAGLEAGTMLPWAVRDKKSGAIVGSTRYHDIGKRLNRVEIGYTFYAKRWQRTALNTSCKLMLLSHAFETLGCQVAGLRTDRFNHRSQRAIEALGAQKDGVIRHFQLRPDGSPRDTVMYSILQSEWPDVKKHLQLRLERNQTAVP